MQHYSLVLLAEARPITIMNQMSIRINTKQLTKHFWIVLNPIVWNAFELDERFQIKKKQPKILLWNKSYFFVCFSSFDFLRNALIHQTIYNWSVEYDSNNIYTKRKQKNWVRYEILWFSQMVGFGCLPFVLIFFWERFQNSTTPMANAHIDTT